MNGYPRSVCSDDKEDSDSDGSDTAQMQIEFPTWNSHDSATGQKFLDTAENKKYYRLWMNSSDATAATSGAGETRPDRYETVFPSAENPPPLPPRSYRMKHRPLERTKALEHGSSSPPKVSRHYKPFFTCDNSAPALPPRPRRLINPEDAFNFEIIDIDEQQELRNIFALTKAIAPLATPESEMSCEFSLTSSSSSSRYCGGGGSGGRSNVADASSSNNHSSQNCDIKVNSVYGGHHHHHHHYRSILPPKYTFNGITEVELGGRPIRDEPPPPPAPLLAPCFLTVPESTNNAVSPVSPNSAKSANSISTPTSDSGVVFSEVGCRDYTSSSTESELEPHRGGVAAYRGPFAAAVNGQDHNSTVRGHKLLSRQISHPPDSSLSQLLRVQCPPTPTHRSRRFRESGENRNGSPAMALPADRHEVFKSNTQSPLRRARRNAATAAGGSGEASTSRRACDSSNSESDDEVPAQSLRRRTVRLPSISENSRMQKVDILPDGDCLPAG